MILIFKSEWEKILVASGQLPESYKDEAKIFYLVKPHMLSRQRLTV